MTEWALLQLFRVKKKKADTETVVQGIPATWFGSMKDLPAKKRRRLFDSTRKAP